MADPTGNTTRDRSLFGHPIGLSYLFTTEMAERFSYYGMTAILVYYLTQQLLLPGHVEHVIGHAAVKQAFESIVGGLTPQEFAADIAGLYTGFVYLTPFFGGMLADRVLGQRYTVVAGGITMAAGEFVLTQDSLFYLGLLMLIVGNGLFKPNISTQVGNLYRPGDSRVDRAYSIFYVGINIGATLAPLVCGSLGELVAWHWGFFAAGVALSLGVLVYLYALRTLPPDRITQARREGNRTPTPRLTMADWKTVAALVLFCIPTTLFWMAYQQQSITILFWARDYTDRTFIPGIMPFDMPASWSQSICPFMIVAFTPLIIRLWAWQTKRGKEPSTPIKMVYGNVMLAASFLFMAGVAEITGPSGHASWLWLILFFAIYTMGELYLSPIGLALVARVAPRQVVSMMMGFWFISTFLGYTFAGYIGSFWDRMGKPEFFLLAAALPAAGALITWVFSFPLTPILHKKAESMRSTPAAN